MHLWQHPNGWFYAVDGSAKRRTALKTKDRDEALRLLKDDEIARAKPKGDSIAAIVEAYLNDRADRSSHAKMQDAWKALKPFFGHLRPDQISRVETRNYIRGRAGRSDGTLRKELGVLQAAVRWSGHRDFKCELPAAPAPRDVFITKQQFGKLLNAAKAEHVKTFLMLAWYTAARKEAILSLEWRAVDFERGRIGFGARVGNKGRADVPLAPDLRRWLVNAHAGRASQHVVEWAGGRVLSIRKGFEEACARAKLTHITIHDLRRSAARHMVENGVSIHEVAQLLGHSNIATTYQVYARFSPHHLKKAVSKL